MNSNRKTFWVTWIIVSVMVIVGFSFLQSGLIDYGIALFCATPFCIGILTGVMPNPQRAILGMITAIAGFLLFLAFFGFEGAVCIVLAAPIVAFFIFLGYLVYLIIKYFTSPKDDIKLTILPIIMFATAIAIESFWQGTAAYDEVTTTTQLQYPTSDVYNNIKHVDTVTARPSWLHNLGLPYPRKCILTTEKVGGLRICEFDEGNIIETITTLKENELLEMDVTEFNLPGQRWLSFQKDLYKITGDEHSTIISRKTTYTSSLKPRMYWKWIEKITIGAEQELVFQNLKHQLSIKE